MLSIASIEKLLQRTDEPVQRTDAHNPRLSAGMPNLLYAPPLPEGITVQQLREETDAKIKAAEKICGKKQTQSVIFFEKLYESIRQYAAIQLAAPAGQLDRKYLDHVKAMQSLAQSYYEALQETTDPTEKEQQAKGFYFTIRRLMKVRLDALPGTDDLLAYEKRAEEGAAIPSEKPIEKEKVFLGIRNFMYLYDAIQRYKVIPSQNPDEAASEKYQQYVTHVEEMKGLMKANYETLNLLGSHEEKDARAAQLYWNARLVLQIKVCDGLTPVHDLPNLEPTSCAQGLWAGYLSQLHNIIQGYQFVEHEHYNGKIFQSSYEKLEPHVAGLKAFLNFSMNTLADTGASEKEAFAKKQCRQFFSILHLEIAALAPIKAAIEADAAKVEAQAAARPAPGCRP